MKDQPKKTEQDKAQEFVTKYQELCNEYRYQIVVTPAFRSRDDGTWSVVLQTSVSKLPKTEPKMLKNS